MNLKSTDRVLANIQEVWKGLSLVERTGSNKNIASFLLEQCQQALSDPVLNKNLLKKEREN